MGVRIIGQTNIVEQPGSPRYSYSKEGTSAKRVFRGSLNALKESRPIIGQTTFDGLNVISVEIYPTSTSEFGEMVIQYDNFTSLFEDSELESEVLSDDIEVEWTQLEKPLAKAPFFKGLNANDLKVVENILSGSADESELQELSSLGKKYYEKRARGQTSYIVFAPVVKHTTQHRGKPSCGSCVKISAPPMGVGGYIFVKTASRISKSNSSKYWTKSEEWTGADEWDNDLY